MSILELKPTKYIMKYTEKVNLVYVRNFGNTQLFRAVIVYCQVYAES